MIRHDSKAVEPVAPNCFGYNMIVYELRQHGVFQPNRSGRCAIQCAIVYAEPLVFLHFFDNINRERASETKRNEVIGARPLKVRKVSAIIIGVIVDSSHT